jgi:hypothetical protein
MFWELILDVALLSFVVAAAIKTDGVNFKYLSFLWGMILLVSLSDYFVGYLFEGYSSNFYLVAISLTLIVISMDFLVYNKMTRWLTFLMTTQACYWLTMLLYYRDFPNHQFFSFITNNSYEIAVTLALAQIMAAFHGDTRILTKILGYITSVSSDIRASILRQKEGR